MNKTAVSWLDAYPQVEEHYLAAGGDRAPEVAIELGKFFELTCTTNAPLAMVSPKMDLMWHKFIEFTEFYGAFCNERYGGMIHHRPRTAASPVPEAAVRNFHDAYEAQYQTVPAIWWEGVPNEVHGYAVRQIDQMPPAYRWSGWPGRS